jgi:tripartite-type tricarboxylate transporter receptor subunit TctC
VKGFQSEAWYGLVAPARLPAPVLRRVHEQAVAALTSKESRERLTAQGGEVVASSPEAFAAFIRDEIARYAPVVKAAGIVAE